ncbi:phosphatase PAP2 family protein [Frondihabitans sp. PAMC 28766]|uniref:phosphatase PAP2 family protein n=1 Tax=Frondihabitans sp. PAMC 28766 TaxID=1795630 RepID=UPI0009E9E682|nr:phosphatase PAP2 family protein [Frondihabitans sp. PAMC 28766]
MNATTVSTSTAVRRQVPTRWVLTSAVSVVALGGVYSIAVLTKPGQEIEDSILRSVDGSTLLRSGRALDAISIPAVLLVVGIVVVIALLRRRPGAAVQASVLIVGAIATAQMIKAIAPRPELTSLTLSNSFPSGHATIALAGVLGLATAFGRHLRPFIMIVGTAFAAAVAEQTVAYGWHRVSDICGACAVTMLWLAIVRGGAAVWSNDPRDTVGRRAHGFTSGLLGLAMVATLAAAGAVFAIGIGSDISSMTTTSPGVLTGARLLSAGVVLATAWLAWKLDRSI